MKEVLSYQSVEICFNGQRVVHDVNFTLHPGEILGIVGESGSGKSTILKAAMGLLGNSGRVTKGNLCFQGKSLLDLSEKEFRKIRGEQIGMIFQDAGASLCPIRKIGSQIYESITAHKKMTREEAKEKALNLLEKLNFQDVERIWNSYPFELSGGMNQRVGIAIAMLMEPSVLLADEPTSALDVTVQQQIMELLKNLKEERNLSYLFICHNLALVQMFCDRVLVMKDGKIVEEGTPDEVILRPENEYTKMLVESVF